MSETEPKYYTKSEVNHMLGEVEQQKWNLFSDYAALVQRISELEAKNTELEIANAFLKISLAELKNVSENLHNRNQNLRGILVDSLRGY